MSAFRLGNQARQYVREVGLESRPWKTSATAWRSSAGAAAISPVSSSRPSTMLSTSSMSWLLKKSPPPRPAKASSLVATKAGADQPDGDAGAQFHRLGGLDRIGYQRLEKPSTRAAPASGQRARPESLWDPAANHIAVNVTREPRCATALRCDGTWAVGVDHRVHVARGAYAIGQRVGHQQAGQRRRRRIIGLLAQFTQRLGDVGR